MVMRPYVTYTPCAMYSRGVTGDIITFTQFEEGDILPKTRNNAESGDESNDDSILPPLLSEEEFMPWILAMNHIMILYLQKF